MLQTIVNITGVNAILQSVLLSLFFMINKKGYRLNNRILGWLLLAFGILIFSTMPGASYLFGSYYKISFLLRRAAFLIAPVFYFYIQSSLNHKFHFRWKHLLHFIPFFILFGLTVFQAFFYHIWMFQLKEEYFLHTAAILIHNIIYLGLSAIILKKHQISLKTFFTKSEDIHGKWLRFFVLGFIIFYDFINQYRIEESKYLLVNGSNGKKTILEIAYEVGFNSKSTFNLAFKKQTGMTPSEFQKSYKH